MNLELLLLIFAQTSLVKDVIPKWGLNLEEGNILLLLGFPDEAVISFSLNLLDLAF